MVNGMCGAFFVKNVCNLCFIFYLVSICSQVAAGGQSWVIRRTHANFVLLDEQLHRCVWDRSFSRLEQLKSLAPTTSSSSSKGKRQASSCANISLASATSAATSRRRTTSAGNNHHGACEDLVVVVGGDEDAADHEDNASQQQNDYPDEEHVGATHKHTYAKL